VIREQGFIGTMNMKETYWYELKNSRVCRYFLKVCRYPIGRPTTVEGEI
jgi:hypothetical protein